ncbi:MAG TPA: hypothetical protein VGL71_09170 [Urbifossiella sp.]
MPTQTETPPRIVEIPALETAPRLHSAETPILKSVTVVTVPAAPPAASFWKRNRTIILFILLLIAADLGIGMLSPLWERHSPDDYALKIRGCAREPRDLVFVGGSPVAEGIDPDCIAGISRNGRSLNSVYAMGLSGGTTSDFYHALLRGCPTPPHVLVYGITASDLNDGRNEPHGPYSLMTWGDLGRWVRLRPESREWAVRHFTLSRIGQMSNLFRYRHGIRMWAACEADERIPGSCPDAMREADELRERADRLQIGNGYAPARGYSVGNYAAVKAAGLAPTHFPYLAKYRTGAHIKYLHLIIDWCVTNDVELILMDMPTTADLETIHAAEFAEFRSRLAEVQRDRGVKVIHASLDAVGLNDAHFADLIHMNLDGARIFSEWVKQTITSSR